MVFDPQVFLKAAKEGQAAKGIRPVPVDELDLFNNIDVWNNLFADYPEARQIAKDVAIMADHLPLMIAVFTWCTSKNTDQTLFNSFWGKCLLFKSVDCLTWLGEWLTATQDNRWIVKEMFDSLFENGLPQVAVDLYNADDFDTNPADIIECVIEFSAMGWPARVACIEKMQKSGVDVNVVMHSGMEYYPVLQSENELTSEQWDDLFILGANPNLIPRDSLLSHEKLRAVEMDEQYSRFVQYNILQSVVSGGNTAEPVRKKM